jgi:hypothetical protein
LEDSGRFDVALISPEVWAALLGGSLLAANVLA